MNVFNKDTYFESDTEEESVMNKDNDDKSMDSEESSKNEEDMSSISISTSDDDQPLIVRVRNRREKVIENEKSKINVCTSPFRKKIDMTKKHLTSTSDRPQVIRRKIK